MHLVIPEALKKEHEDLHLHLRKLTEIQGEVGAAARDLAAILHPHFLKEEDFALPLLSLLKPMAEGKETAEPAKVIAMGDHLKEVLPEMIREHGHILEALATLARLAREQGMQEVILFADKLLNHARVEEQVLYPAGVLIGDFLRLKMKK